MKIYSLYLFIRQGAQAILQDKAQDFSDIGILYRKNAVEISDFAAKQLAESPNPDMYVSAQEKDLLFHSYKHESGAVAIIVADKEYPSRVAFAILREIMQEYTSCGGKLPGGKSQTIQKAITQYQNPSNADKITRIQSNLEETKQIMVQNLEMAIGRGESLNELVQKSQEISDTSKVFAREADKMHGCCSNI